MARLTTESRSKLPTVQGRGRWLRPLIRELARPASSGLRRTLPLRAWDVYGAYRSHLVGLKERHFPATSIDPPPVRNGRGYGTAYARAHLLEDLLPFWARHGKDDEHGGFLTCLNRSGEVFDSAKSSAMHGRMAWGFSVGHELDPDGGNLALARHAANFLMERMWDPNFGGWYSTTYRDGVADRADKELFAQAYALFGLIRCARAGDDEALLERAIEVWELLDERAWDREQLGYVERCHRDWTVKSATKTICVQLDMLKVALSLHATTGDVRILSRAVELADLVATRMRDPRHGSVLENFSRDWTYDPLPTRDTLQLGHNLKAVRLLIDVSAACHESRHHDTAREIMGHVLARGWDRRHGGFYQFAFRSGRPVTSEKLWWVQCEGVPALFSMHGLTGEMKYLDLAHRLIDFSFNHFADSEYGEWYTSCTADGRPKIEDKGSLHKAACHTVDFCLAIVEQLGEAERRAGQEGSADGSVGAPSAVSASATDLATASSP